MPREPKDKRPPITSSRSTKQAAILAAAEEKKATLAFPNLEEMIRNRAYEFYEQRGRQDGCDQDDWFRAEAEVQARFNKRTA